MARLIKRYGLERLYDTTTLSYVDLAQLRALVHGGEAVRIIDAATGADITTEFLPTDH